MSFGDNESSMSLPSREDSHSPCSTDPGLIAGTWHRPLFLTRDGWFESTSLQRRVRRTLFRVEAGFSGFTAMLTMHQFVPRLFEELADIVLGHPIDAGVDDLGCRLVIVEREQRVHRLLAHLERALPDECGDVALFEEMQLGRQCVGGDRHQLAALEAIGIVVEE